MSINYSWRTLLEFSKKEKNLENNKMHSKPMIFIDYSHKDKQFVELLSEKLNNLGIDTWIDFQQINPGTMWQYEIKKGIDSASILLIVLSDNYLDKVNYVLSNGIWEVLAKTSNKVIIPIKIGDFQPDRLPLFLNKIQFIDFTDNFSEGFQLLLNSLPDEYKSNKPIAKKEEKSKGYVFLSFTEEDSDFVLSLRDFLKSQKFAYWDFEEGERNYNTHFFMELESVINESVAVLSVISPHWKKSKWSIREYFYAEEIGKPVLLLRARITNPILAIAGLPFIDFVQKNNKGFEKLGKELKKRLN